MESVEIKQKVQAILRGFTFVQWDRFVAGKHNWSFYGWIKRKDAHEDFLVLVFSADKSGKLDVWFLTSSKRYDPQIKRLLGEKRGLRCKRVEDYFDMPNMIKL